MTKLAAIRTLIADLRQIHDAPLNNSSTERHRYIHALQVIGLCLEALGESKLADWVAHFRLQLHDLDLGVVSPALTPNPDVANRPNPSMIAMCQATVAVGVAKLAEGGLRRSDIKKKLDGKKYADLRQLTRAGKGLGTSALSWHDEYRKGRKNNYLGCRIWNEMRANSAGLPPLEAAEHCFRVAADQLGRRPQSSLRIAANE